MAAYAQSSAPAVATVQPAVMLKMSREEYRATAPALAYELGSAAALVKFAGEYPQFSEALYGRLLPDHHELLARFGEAGAQLASRD